MRRIIDALQSDTKRDGEGYEDRFLISAYTASVLCVSRTPFFDAARELVANGYDPNLTLIMRHAGSDTDSLTAKLGTAASLTLEETDYGPKLRRWKPFSTLAVAPRNAPANRGATTPQPAPNRTPLGTGK